MKKKDSIARGFLRISLIFLGCDKKTKRTLDIAKEKYMNQLDIKNIIKKFYEID
jgi:3-deoxy-D-manno-octulosonic acid (KDO) 8-phosphate synthase